jgi:N-acetylmuramoyl-L-alanine amidase
MNLSVAQNLPSGWGRTEYFLHGSTPYTWFITYSSAKWVNEIRLTDTGVVTSHTSDLAGIGVYYANSNTGWTKINVTVKRNGNDWVFVFSQAVEAKNFMLHMATPSNRIHCKWLEANFYGVYDPQGGANDAAYTYNGSSTPTGPKIKIYIDQGHNMAGNHNSGAQGNGLDEGRVVYNVGILLKNLLEADGRFEVMVSRPTASTVLGTNNSTSLSARYNAANSWGADYFVSLHCNAASADAHGIEVLTYTNNANNETYKFGNSILNALCSATGWRNRGMKQRTDLAVLMHTSMPAALVEMGFITNASEASVMANNPSLLANGIYRGILNYFGY